MKDNINYKWDDVEFHKTFTPQDNYITKILELADKNFSGTKEEISEITGIPTGKTSGKVIPHIKYSYYMGFINYSKMGSIFMLKLTDLGKKVFNEDKYLFENISKLIAHYYICDPYRGAAIWSFIYKSLPYKLDNPLNINMIKTRFNDIFHHDDNNNLRIVKKSYSEGFWKPLKLMEWNDSLILNSKSYNRDYKYVYAYTLLDSWEFLKNSERELTVEQLSDELYWFRRFGFDISEAMNVLDELAFEKIVSVNKQLHPCTVVRLAQSEDIIDHLYDSLM